MSLNAYERARNIIETPRQAERRLMWQITGDMIEARDAGHSRGQLMPALHRNRELWHTFSAVCGTTGNELPPTARASIISLALWVDQFTSDVIAGRESIDDLIAVNCDIIEGLSGTGIATA
ncbi:flagellar biosynthesis regulator FlaF [Sphingomonas sp. 37zxx]|uniref:flagellar biosynthesis regulator FlaF n=1 Tax=Sphingomonas sp. 37zxx TaxID=1550073 RepID=UPI00053BF437|nr:flagellar biosynthesis regulator FlaF [Sphingomonas sp. 37zxx]